MVDGQERLKLFTAVTGTILIYALACSIDSHSGMIKNLFDAMGEYGMDIYILSEDTV